MEHQGQRGVRVRGGGQSRGYHSVVHRAPRAAASETLSGSLKGQSYFQNSVAMLTLSLWWHFHWRCWSGRRSSMNQGRGTKRGPRCSETGSSFTEGCPPSTGGSCSVYEISTWSMCLFHVCDEMGNTHGTFLLKSEICWFSQGKSLKIYFISKLKFILIFKLKFKNSLGSWIVS